MTKKQKSEDVKLPIKEKRKANAHLGPIASVPIRDRHAILLENIEKGMSVYKAGVAAGFTHYTMNSQPGKVVETALKRQRYLAEQDDGSELTVYQKLGLTKEEILEQFKKVIMQDKDLSSKMKALASPLKDAGIELDPTDSKVVVPVFNVSVQKTSENTIRDANNSVRLSPDKTKEPDNTA